MTTPQPVEPSQPRRISRGMTVVIILLGGVIALIGATQTWVTATGFEAAHIDQIQLSGQEASPVITAMALVTIAAGAALSIARRVGRWVIGVLVILAGATLGAVTISIQSNPGAAVAQKIAETTGTTGATQLAPVVEVSVLPWLTVLGGLIAVIGGLLTLVAGGRWIVGKTKKYDVAGPAVPDRDGRLDEIDTWDELSRGEDPT